MHKHQLLLGLQCHLAKVSTLNLGYLCRRYLSICDEGHVNTVKVRRDARFRVQRESHIPTPPSVAPSLCFFSAIFVSLVVRTQLLEYAFPILLSHKIIWATHSVLYICIFVTQNMRRICVIPPSPPLKAPPLSGRPASFL